MLFQRYTNLFLIFFNLTDVCPVQRTDKLHEFQALNKKSSHVALVAKAAKHFQGLQAKMLNASGCVIMATRAQDSHPWQNFLQSFLTLYDFIVTAATHRA